MFRPATIKEVECLLRAQGKEPVRPPYDLDLDNDPDKVVARPCPVNPSH